MYFMKTSKEKILNAALTVFSEKGYDGALLRDISDSLGITKPALYKHFDSKETLWNSMIDYVEAYYHEHTGKTCDMPIPDNWHQFKELSMSQIDFTLHDYTVRRVRRLLTIEQYRNKRITALATKHFITDIESRYTYIFNGMVKKRIFSCEDTRLLAFQFTAPITLLIHYCDREPDKEAQIVKKIEAHINKFEKIIKNNRSTPI